MKKVYLRGDSDDFRHAFNYTGYEVVEIHLSVSEIDFFLGGIMIIVFAIGPKVCGFIPSQERWIFEGDKSPYRDFLRRGSKAVGPM
jgi:hypothetical protein